MDKNRAHLSDKFLRLSALNWRRRAKEFGIPLPTFYQWKNRQNKPSLTDERVLKYGESLGLKKDEIFQGK